MVCLFRADIVTHLHCILLSILMILLICTDDLTCLYCVSSFVVHILILCGTHSLYRMRHLLCMYLGQFLRSVSQSHLLSLLQPVDQVVSTASDFSGFIDFVGILLFCPSQYKVDGNPDIVTHLYCILLSVLMMLLIFTDDLTCFYCVFSFVVHILILCGTHSLYRMRHLLCMYLGQFLRSVSQSHLLSLLQSVDQVVPTASDFSGFIDFVGILLFYPSQDMVDGSLEIACSPPF